MRMLKKSGERWTNSRGGLNRMESKRENLGFEEYQQNREKE